MDPGNVEENTEAMKLTRAIPWPDLVMTTIVILFLGDLSHMTLAQVFGGQEGPPTTSGEGAAAPGGQDGGEPGSSTSPRVDPQVRKANAQGATSSQGVKPSASQGQAPGTSRAKMTEAERIAVLQRLIMTNRKELEELRRKRDANRENQDAQKAFEVLDDKLEARKKALQEAQQKGASEKVKELSGEVAELQKPWQLAKDRFDLDLRERKAVQERIGILEATIKHDENVLDELLGNKADAKPVPKDQMEKPARGSRAGGACGSDLAACLGTSEGEPWLEGRSPACGSVTSGAAGIVRTLTTKASRACAGKDPDRQLGQSPDSTAKQGADQGRGAGQEESGHGQQDRTPLGVSGRAAPERRTFDQSGARSPRDGPATGEERATKPGPLQPPGKREGDPGGGTCRGGLAPRSDPGGGYSPARRRSRKSRSATIV